MFAMFIPFNDRPNFVGSNKLIMMLADGSDATLLTAPVSNTAQLNVLSGGDVAFCGREMGTPKVFY
ncbi:MAG: hypothetical protein J7485_04420 [Sphingobium sp.]|nr:hypothetical protein [Sphingobium sp.]